MSIDINSLVKFDNPVDKFIMMLCERVEKLEENYNTLISNFSDYMCIDISSNDNDDSVYIFNLALKAIPNYDSEQKHFVKKSYIILKQLLDKYDISDMILFYIFYEDNDNVIMYVKIKTESATIKYADLFIEFCSHSEINILLDKNFTSFVECFRLDYYSIICRYLNKRWILRYQKHHKVHYDKVKKDHSDNLPFVTGCLLDLGFELFNNPEYQNLLTLE